MDADEIKKLVQEAVEAELKARAEAKRELEIEKEKVPEPTSAELAEPMTDNQIADAELIKRLAYALATGGKLIDEKPKSDTDNEKEVKENVNEWIKSL